MISSEKSGVWLLDDAYHKDNAGYWDYSEAPGLYHFNDYYLSDGVQYSSPVQIPGTNWSASGDNAAVKSDGTLWVWGDNGTGTLAQNDTVQRSSPIQIPGTQWVNCSAALNTLAAIKTDGTLWMAGDYYGISSWNSAYRRSSPIQIPGTQWDFYKISKGTNLHFFAVKGDGTLWSWGYAYYGYLGLNQSYTSSPFGPIGPQQVGSNTTWVNAKATYRSGIATKTDGTLWAWGGSSVGTRYIPWNSTINYSSPIQIPGTSWDKLGGAGAHPLATKTDGTLWAWGSNSSGALAQNTSGGYFSSPVQIPGTNWDRPINQDVGFAPLGCWKTDGTLWVWGANNGSLGLNDNIPRSSPTQVPGNQWNSAHYRDIQLRISA